MSEFKGTPGPWVLLPEECDRPYIRVRGSVLGGRFKIANVLTTYYEGVHHREAEETRANAKLIAAAPRLLKELQHLVRHMEPLEENGGLKVPGLATLNGARAAIAAATT